MGKTLEDKLMTAFGRRLAEVRKQKGLTQQQLAEKLDISLVSIAYIETGKRWPRLVTLSRIADALGVNIDQLFKGI
jgi:transcriptional regulator with XRE-family HTH domain